MTNSNTTLTVNLSTKNITDRFNGRGIISGIVLNSVADGIHIGDVINIENGFTVANDMEVIGIMVHNWATMLVITQRFLTSRLVKL